MSRIVFAICAVAILSAAAQAQTYRPDFDPGRLKGPARGDPSQVLVLGGPHLSGLPASFKAAGLQPVLDRLRRWHPQVIAVEALSGPQCDFLRRYPARYRETIESYCWDPTPAQVATGMDVPAATTEAVRVLAQWPTTATPAMRRRLAALFLAGGEQASALVQWLRLPESERHAEAELAQPLVDWLEKLRQRRDESTLIGARLAADLGLERVFSMDDHTADAPILDEAAYGAAIGKAWSNPATDRRKAVSAALEANLGSPDAVLAMYRAYNAPGEAKLVFDSDFGAALEEASPQKFGRGYVAYWETRNLRMASNIRDVLGSQSGVRALVIVGESHKGYLEAYLNEMHDVRIVDATGVLR